tara:strand:+ start:247 stop:351 length:105 start_codon:yes stop_codon:yes gene_type:complete
LLPVAAVVEGDLTPLGIQDLVVVLEEWHMVIRHQ